MDAGPSPDDLEGETFCRHDILSLAVVGDRPGGHGYIAAGLVDGTLRVFDANFSEWAGRRLFLYDATGSCDRATTAIPVATDETPRTLLVGYISGYFFSPSPDT